MRLLVFFFLVTALNAQPPLPPRPLDPRGIRFGLDQGIPDGSIVTFFFYHTGRNEHWSDDQESVQVNFYDQGTIDLGNYENYDITAHLQIDRARERHVWAGSKENGKWLAEGDGRRAQAMDEISNKMEKNRPPSIGFWRVDVIKHDEYQMSVFFQGFWSGVRKFEKSLNKLRSVYITSPGRHVNYVHAEMRLQPPNYNLAPFSAARFEETMGRTQDAKIISFPNWPINRHIEMAIVLRATAKRSYEQFDVPRLIFSSADGSITIMKMHHLYFGLDPWAYPHQLWIDVDSRSATETPCKNSGESNGDLQHIYLQRISQNEIGVQVFYKPSGASGLSCVHMMTPVHANALDKPFNIISHQGAVIVHLEHSIPL